MGHIKMTDLTPAEAARIHDYIKKFDLLQAVEDRTKKNWRGVGSRATYYNAISKTMEGAKTKLTEWLMLEEAQHLVHEHQNKTLNESDLMGNGRKED